MLCLTSWNRFPVNTTMAETFSNINIAIVPLVNQLVELDTYDRIQNIF